MADARKKLIRLLIDLGEEGFRRRKRFVKFTNDPAVDPALNDLDNTPQYFAFACLACKVPLLRSTPG